MDFQLSEEQRAFQEVARNFARDRIAPEAARWDREFHFPVEVLREAAALGFGAIYCDPAYGGSGLGRLDSTLILEELAAACPSTAAFVSIHNMVAWLIDRFGSEAQKDTWLPRLAPMDIIASYCLTEPGSGSDAASLTTRAERDGEDYVLTGTKAFISGAGASDVYLVMCRTGGPGPKGISAILVPKETPGLTFGKQEEKLGWHSQPTAQVILEGARVPVGNRIGAEGEGFTIAMAGLDGGRLNIAACSLGGARAAFDAALEHVKDRKQFGQAIAEFQATQFTLADMATELEAARLLLHKAAQALDAADTEATKLSAMAKRLCTDTGFSLVDRALQLFGGYGYLMDYPVERYLRDLRVHRILEGTNEIMRVVIARRLLAASN